MKSDRTPPIDGKITSIALVDPQSTGVVVRRLVGLHDVSQVGLAQFIGSRKQSLGPILSGRKPVGRDLLTRLSGAFCLPVEVLTCGDVRVALTAGLLTMDFAPIANYDHETEPVPDDASGKHLRDQLAEMAREWGHRTKVQFGDGAPLLQQAREIAALLPASSA